MAYGLESFIFNGDPKIRLVLLIVCKNQGKVVRGTAKLYFLWMIIVVMIGDQQICRCNRFINRSESAAIDPRTTNKREG